ncbi:MAG: type IX secretion system sortase PorU [Bacteroides sp.]|nr:type IX secretion system sortase PorU [Bacteroides sp.]MCM1379050.1 type IX secretion system sortase PorU [Bacteroides sp.]MCM1445748.1 type IX secretion system sortase PorU [Prevotella sp.]
MKRIFHIIYLISFLLLTRSSAAAFSLDSYTLKSVLASGKWVKISVEQSGMHCITPQTLSKWGFSDPARVRVYGYGGAMLSDVLNPDEYVDDLPQVASQVTSKGLVFYATGPQQVNLDKEGTLSHAINPYSSYGFYFLTEGEAATPAPQKGGSEATSGTYFSRWMAYYDPQDVNIGNSGRMMVGDDFKTQRERTYSVQLPGIMEGVSASVNVCMVANASSRTDIRLSIDGTALPVANGDYINLSSDDSGVYGMMSTISKKDVRISGNETKLNIRISNSGIVRSAWLNYFEIIYSRTHSGSQEILTSQNPVQSDGAKGTGRHVWDVTDPRNQYELTVGDSGAWSNDRAGIRRYIVWGETDNMPEPRFVENVANQNLHGLAIAPDMIIITPQAYSSAATTIADIHRNHATEKLVVEVVDLNEILNEFGSGAFDPGALRRFLKMVYDRGLAPEAERPLRYALLMGKGTFDNRALTGVGRSLSSPMPLWVSEASLNDSQSFSTDDYFALLDDYDGTRPGAETLNIAVGRIPATSLSEAKTAAEKIQQYIYSMPTGRWRATMSILADDENQGQHTTQSETLVRNLMSGASGQRIIVDKIYCDAYVRQNSTYPKVREDLFRNFSDGMGIFAFVGHGSPTALGSKSIIQPADFRKYFYLRRLPFFYAATCSFLKWDNDSQSQAEQLMFQSDGGFIGCISALRPVYITYNGNLTASLGKVLAQYDSDGNVPTIGEIYRLTKNGVGNDTNKMRYVLMSDPALRLALPSNEVTLDEVNGHTVTADDPATLMARQEVTLRGRVTNSAGELLSDFNGTVTATFYDAEFSTTTYGYGEGGQEIPFEEIGAILFVGSGQATNGEYEITVRMPANISDNYRPATMSLYAISSASDRTDALGVSRNLYAFGYDENAAEDSERPKIHSLTLNGEEFKSGDAVNDSPLLIARISDNSGLNMSTAGVGQRMSLNIDGSDILSDLSSYFTPDAIPFEGKMSGTLYYPLESLDAGDHTMTLRVWDVDGNYADASIDCEVKPGLAPEIYEVYTDAMPARSEARFFVRHNRPDQVVRLTVSVYDLMGRHVWSGETEARSDMETTNPLTWDLRNSGGQRVPRGIYLYRAELASGQSDSASKTKKLAVANE